MMHMRNLYLKQIMNIPLSTNFIKQNAKISFILKKIKYY